MQRGGEGGEGGEGGGGGGLLQSLAAPAARGGDAALRGEGRLVAAVEVEVVVEEVVVVVQGRAPGCAQVLLGQPDGA